MTPTVPYSNRTTSKEAADSVKEEHPNLALTVLATIPAVFSHGATCEELEIVLNRSHQSTSSALRRLALQGKVFDSRARRRTRSGRNAIVWTTTNP